MANIHSEKDIKLGHDVIANTKGPRARPGTISGLKAETLLYCALIGYIHYEAPVEGTGFSTLIEFIMRIRRGVQDP